MIHAQANTLLALKPNMQRWQALANHQALQARARMYQQIRQFFLQRNVLEVETPILGAASVTDPYIESLQAGNAYLQTSPEYFMKRLLVGGSGDIYQLGKVFRKEEIGRFHHTEFSLLEWYRLDFDQWDLMAELADLIEQLLGFSHFDYLSYQALFQQYLGIDPHTATLEQLRFEAQEHINIAMPRASKDDWLNLLLSHLIEPELRKRGPVFIYDYPPSQAVLAKTSTDESGNRVAERFELYIHGLELANGFHELTDAAQQRQRFEHDNQLRQQMGLRPVAIDENLLAALENGLPPCSGVAVGLDRLLMLKLGSKAIDEVLSFRS